MSLMPLFSRRKREATGMAEVYQYDAIPQRLRVQLVQIINDGIGKYYGHEYSGANPAGVWRFINKTMCRELGVFTLARNVDNKQEDFDAWLLNVQSVDDFIDGLELCLKAINTVVRDARHFDFQVADATPDKAIAEANARMKEAGFGYRFESNEIIRVDSEFIHSEAVVPALKLLGTSKYSTANQEFREAHEAYRQGRNEDCLIGCAKSFESVLKIIAKDRRWPVKETDTAKALLDGAFSAGFLSAEVQQGFNSLRSLLESGIPTPRNKSAGHGAGTKKRNVPDRLAAFQLHQTASAILFLAETHKES